MNLGVEVRNVIVPHPDETLVYGIFDVEISRSIYLGEKVWESGLKIPTSVEMLWAGIGKLVGCWASVRGSTNVTFLVF